MLQKQEVKKGNSYIITCASDIEISILAWNRKMRDPKAKACGIKK